MSFVKGQKPWNKGLKYNDKQKEKIVLSSKSIDVRKKISAGIKARIEKLGYRYTPEQRANWSKIMKEKGIKPTKPYIAYGKNNHFYGKSTAREKNPNWKGGITPINTKIRTSTEGMLWRKAIFIRDSFTCQKYNTKGGKLIAHHINNFAEYPELRFAIDNGITLSKKAHIEFHNKYGRKHNTKEQLEEFLKNK